MAFKKTAPENKAQSTTPAAPIGRLIERGFGPGTLMPGAGKLVQRTGEPVYCGAIVGRAFGYTEHPNAKDATKVSVRFAGQFIGIKADGTSSNTNEAYLPSTIQSTVKAALDVQRGTQLAEPVAFSIEVWCEPAEKSPVGYAYVCYDRMAVKTNDPLLSLAYESGLIERPAAALTDQRAGENVDPETGEVTERAA